MTIRKFTFALPPDLRGQLWVAAGVPIGLAILARAMSELELALARRHEQLAELDAKIAAAKAEYGRLLGAAVVPAFRTGRRTWEGVQPGEGQTCVYCNDDTTQATRFTEGGLPICDGEHTVQPVDEPSPNGAAPADAPAAAGP